MLANVHHEPPPLELVKVWKRFGSFVANEEVSFKVTPGSFHALLGENGAGKSTLVKCIMGYHAADEGDIIVDGASRDIRSPHDAYKLGIGMVYQHFTVVPAMTVAENLLLARPDLPRIINWKAEYERLAKFLETAPFKVELDAKISDLAAGQKQKVEILKQLYLDSKILILDEPTSVLTPQEADEVLGMLRKMVDAKKLSVLIITHKFREVTTYCDEITVLRKGKQVGSGRVKDMTTSEMAAMMMGEERRGKTIEKAAQKPGDVLFEIKGLRANRDNGVEAVTGIDLAVRAGEIVGIAGISGNGQREFVEVLGGQRPATAGEVRVCGEPFHMTRAEMFRHQFYILPEEPLRNACAPQMTVAENIALRTFDRPPLSRGGWLLNGKAIRENGRKWIEKFKVKTPGANAPIGNLSGGNVQRAVLARELGPGTAKVLVAANPCFGLDFAAVDFIHSQLLEARNKGVAVLLVCEDLDELLSLSDRVVVMAGGRLVYEAPVAEANVKDIGEKMAGH
ncbi:MAG: ABC transporter ATP-binding protein [Chthoniobacteraceae bacterium]